MAHNPKAFEATYMRIQISSKRCYIATQCFGFEDEKTETLRHFKLAIAKYERGLDFIDFYYSFSPGLVAFLEKKPVVQKIFNHFIAQPLLTVFVLIIRPYVQNKKTHF
jgi:hypothetical protein